MNNKITVNEQDYFNLIADGAIANKKTADGRLIPVLILDTTLKKELEYLVEMHGESSLEDVISVWGYSRFNKNIVTLVLIFTNPIELKVAILFDVLKHHTLIEGIRISRAVYIQPGVPGDRVRHDINAPKIIVEVPAKTTFDKWDKILNKALTKKLKREGVGKESLKKAVSNYISVGRDIWGKRIK
jgi:hypothetical protein